MMVMMMINSNVQISDVVCQAVSPFGVTQGFTDNFTDIKMRKENLLCPYVAICKVIEKCVVRKCSDVESGCSMNVIYAPMITTVALVFYY